MPTHPLAEVFGFPTSNLSPGAERYRESRLCPFNNKAPNCTKDKADDPLGVCSVFDGDRLAITCPVRFRQQWLIVEDAARFFFSPGTAWTSLAEVRLYNRHGKSAGNIDLVLVAYDERGRILDFGALEVQAVYISGNVRRPFQYYMDDRQSRTNMDWTSEQNYPRPDYLSSSRKRLAPQLLYKGEILNTWNKKIAVALDQGFFNTLPSLVPVNPDEADIVWMVYDLELEATANQYLLSRQAMVYTKFDESLTAITRPAVGSTNEFIKRLQAKLSEKLESNPPENRIIGIS